MLFFLLIIYLAAIFTIQTTWLDLVSFAGVTPDLALIFVVYCGINFHKNGGVGMGLVVGFIQDCLSGGLLGVNTLSKSLIGFFFSALKDKILVQGFIPISFFLIVASLFDGFIYYAVLVTLLKGSVGGGYLFPRLFVYFIYNAFAGLALFYVFDVNKKWIMKTFPNQILRSSL